MEILSFLQDILGIGEPHVSTGEMLLRLLIVFPLAIFMVRVGDKRFLGELSALDLVVAVMLGSIVSRGITGNAPFLPSIATGFGMVLLHRAVARAGVEWDWFGRVVKGEERKLVDQGEPQWAQMKKAGIGEKDLRGAIRRKSGILRIEEVEVAYLERTGDISVIRKSESGS